MFQLIKNIKRKFDVNYSWFKYKRKEKKNMLRKEVCWAIGYYFKHKNNGDYSKTYREIEMLKIHDITTKKQKVLITLGRPGLLIGKEGIHIMIIKKNLQKKFPKIDISFKESDIDSYLYPFDPSDF